MFARRAVFIVGCALAGVAGMQVMEWYSAPYPVRVHHRHMLTPTVSHEDDVKIGLEVFRDKNCPIRVMRRFRWSNGETLTLEQDLRKDFGPLGLDDYTIRIPIPSNAPYGKAELWSQSCARCNPVQQINRLFESCSSESVDRFEISDVTLQLEYPHGFEPAHDLAVETHR